MPSHTSSWLRTPKQLPLHRSFAHLDVLRTLSVLQAVLVSPVAVQASYACRKGLQWPFNIQIQVLVWRTLPISSPKGQYPLIICRHSLKSGSASSCVYDVPCMLATEGLKSFIHPFLRSHQVIWDKEPWSYTMDAHHFSAYRALWSRRVEV